MNGVIMGGSGSTGSSLLKNILNRNSEIFSGGEISLFSKRLIYDDWSKAKYKILSRKLNGIRNFGFHLYNGTDVLLPEYLWNEQKLLNMAKSTQTIDEFTELFYQPSLKLNLANIWVEKTPANAACFASFLNHFQNGLSIHMVRNPYDTIASLWSRGYDLYYAVGIYLMNTASGLSARHFKGRNHIVSYENLVSEPRKTVSSVCQFLEVPFSSDMLEPQGEVVPDSQLKSWNYDETGKIGKGAVGRFSKLSDEKQNQILEAVNLVYINERGNDYYDLDVNSIKEICDILEYDFYNIGSVRTRGQLIKGRRKDRISRLRRGYPTGVYYPLDIR